MIYRILADSRGYLWDDSAQDLIERPLGTRFRGVFVAGISQGMADLPFPHLTNPRARFCFTEAGWQKYGQSVSAAARRLGHVVRVVRRKNPRQSQIGYQDEYQVAILPIRKGRAGPDR